MSGSGVIGSGSRAGTVLAGFSLEDVLESIIGEEIVDEHGTSVDMREVARLRKKKQFQNTELKPSQEEKDSDETT